MFVSVPAALWFAAKTQSQATMCLWMCLSVNVASTGAESIIYIYIYIPVRIHSQTPDPFLKKKKNVFTVVQYFFRHPQLYKPQSYHLNPSDIFPFINNPRLYVVTVLVEGQRYHVLCQ